jgi:lysophospholipase L1-like esterase
MSNGVGIEIYLNGVRIKQTTEGSPRQSDAPFQIGGRGLSASFADSKFLYDRVVFYGGVLAAKSFARLTRRGGPPISPPPVVVEPLSPSFWWNADSDIGQASGYRPLRWNPKVEAYCVDGEVFPSPGPGGDLCQRHQRALFQPVLAPEQGHFGAASLTPGGSRRYAIASYSIPEGCDYPSRTVTGAVHLHSAKGEAASGAKLDLRVYVNDKLKLDQGVSAQPEAATFAAEVGRLGSGDRLDVAFAPAALGAGEFWFDYKVVLSSSSGPRLPTTRPVNEAFRVETTQPLEENSGWTAYHYQLCAQARSNRIELLFLGDSVTAAWGSTGKAVWENRLARYHPGNFGISGQGTQDVLWRLNHGELDGAHPKAVVLMLGSNDINWPAADIVAGVREVVRQLRAKFPATQLLLGGILPRGEQPNTAERSKILEANTQLAKLDDGRHIHYFYFGDKLLLADGRLPKEIAPDFLHPGERGYQFWADAIEPLLAPIWK